MGNGGHGNEKYDPETGKYVGERGAAAGSPPTPPGGFGAGGSGPVPPTPPNGKYDPNNGKFTDSEKRTLNSMGLNQQDFDDYDDGKYHIDPDEERSWGPQYLNDGFDDVREYIRDLYESDEENGIVEAYNKWKGSTLSDETYETLEKILNDKEFLKEIDDEFYKN